MMLEKYLADILNGHKGKIAGAVLGFITSILLVSFGFWRTLFVIFCVGLGYWIGKSFDEDMELGSWFRTIFRQKDL